MKKLLCVAAIITFVVNAYSQPAWYSEEVTHSEQHIFRVDGVYTDTIYTACASVKLGDKIKSLDKAKDKAIEEAFSKIEKNNSTAKGEKKLLHCFYDENKASAAAYVQVSITTSETNVDELPAEKSQIDLLREYSSYLDVPLEIEDTQVHLAGCLTSNPLVGNSLFGIKFSEETKSILDKKAPVTYKYPNGVPVKDEVVTYSDSELRFISKNFIKRRRTFVIIRADVNTDCDEVTLVCDYVEAKEKINHDQNGHWQNLVFEFEEWLLDIYSPEFILRTDGKSITLGSFFIYQEL